jgi:hypothetical protein
MARGRKGDVADAEFYLKERSTDVSDIRSMNGDGADSVDDDDYDRNVLTNSNNSKNNNNDDTDTYNSNSGSVSGEVSGSEEVTAVCVACDTSGAMSSNQFALQRYLLHCAQNYDGGGLRGTGHKILTCE